MNNKRKERYKIKGSILVITALAAIVWIFIAQSLFIVGASGFGMIKSSRVALQAQQYAEIEIDRLKNVAYENLDSDGAHPRQALTNIQESGWEDEVKVGAENAIHGSDNAKQRIATVNVYKSGDTIPRFTLEVPLSSQGSSVSSGSNENGYWIKYSDGTIIQYGVGSCSGSGYINNFPIPFPHKCISGVANAYTFNVDLSVRFYNPSKTQFYLDLSNNGDQVFKNSCTWIAIGY